MDEDGDNNDGIADVEDGDDGDDVDDDDDDDNDDDDDWWGNSGSAHLWAEISEKDRALEQPTRTLPMPSFQNQSFWSSSLIMTMTMLMMIKIFESH